MRANGVMVWSLTAAVILLAPTGSVGLVGAQARPAADPGGRRGEEDRPGRPGDSQGPRQDPDGRRH